MLFTLEALQARHGDALLLHWGPRTRRQLAVIDGGPARTYARALRPRLEALRASRKAGGTLLVQMLMVSHIDDDHIRGVLDLTGELLAEREGKAKPRWKFRTLWHNSFDDLVGPGSEPMLAAAQSLLQPSAVAAPPSEAGLIFSSVPQGRSLRYDAERLGLAVNLPFPGLVMASPQPVRLAGGLLLRVLGPDAAAVRDLQEKWDQELRRKGFAAAALPRLDRSVFNLSSLVVLAELGRRRMLLTGDARGDRILAALEQAGLLRDGRLHVDLLKLPHHGSDHNVTAEFFERVTADHYVVSGDGNFGNPELGTFELLSAARGRDRFTLHLTYPLAELYRSYPTARLRAFLERERQAGKTYEVRFPEPGRLSLQVDLGETYDGR